MYIADTQAYLAVYSYEATADIYKYVTAVLHKTQQTCIT